MRIILVLALLACGCGDKKQTPPPEPTTESDQATTETTQAAEPAELTCEAVARHVASVVMASNDDGEATSATNDRLKPANEPMAYRAALLRCNRAPFTPDNMRCVLAAKTQQGFIDCQLPP